MAPIDPHTGNVDSKQAISWKWSDFIILSGEMQNGSCVELMNERFAFYDSQGKQVFIIFGQSIVAIDVNSKPSLSNKTPLKGMLSAYAFSDRTRQLYVFNSTSS